MPNIITSDSSALSVNQQNGMSATANKLSGAGKAYQSVAQSTGMAIQDATDALRNVQTMANTAKGVALAQMLVTEDVPTFTKITAAIAVMEAASVANFTSIGSAATSIISSFPSG
ncbi:MAG: hypothetical protein ACI96W_002400 [Paraglaciecola sp.]|jgi:hypothetical protein